MGAKPEAIEFPKLEKELATINRRGKVVEYIKLIPDPKGEKVKYLVLDDGGSRSMVDCIEELQQNKNFESMKNIYTSLYRGIFNLEKLGCLHGDLQPKNVMLDAQCKKLKIVDNDGIYCDEDIVQGKPDALKDWW